MKTWHYISNLTESHLHNNACNSLPSKEDLEYRRQQTYHLSPDTTLHQRLSSRVPINSLDIIAKPTDQTRKTQAPENQTQRQSNSFLDVRSRVLEMEGDEDRDRNHSHVGRETEPGEECTLCGAVVSRVAVIVVEEERGEPGTFDEGSAVV